MNSLDEVVQVKINLLCPKLDTEELIEEFEDWLDKCLSVPAMLRRLSITTPRLITAKEAEVLAADEE